MYLFDDPTYFSAHTGIVGSLFSFLQFVASPVIGAASDVYGRRPLMLFTMVSGGGGNEKKKIRKGKNLT